jgi:hypothetical protein
MRFSRRTFYISIVVLLALLTVPAFIMERSSVNELGRMKSRLAEMSALGVEYSALSDQVGVVEQKSGLSKVSGVANAMEDIASSIGLKEKLKAVRGIGTRDVGGSMTEESAEVQMEKMTLNEIVNMFYRIGDAPMILSVKRAAVKKSFENPELLNVTMTVALFTKK